MPAVQSSLRRLAAVQPADRAASASTTARAPHPVQFLIGQIDSQLNVARIIHFWRLLCVNKLSETVRADVRETNI